MAKSDKGGDDIKVVTRYRRAAHEYELTDRLECGLVLGDRGQEPPGWPLLA